MQAHRAARRFREGSGRPTPCATRRSTQPRAECPGAAERHRAAITCGSPGMIFSFPGTLTQTGSTEPGQPGSLRVPPPSHPILAPSPSLARTSTSRAMLPVGSTCARWRGRARPPRAKASHAGPEGRAVRGGPRPDARPHDRRLRARHDSSVAVQQAPTSRPRAALRAAGLGLARRWLNPPRATQQAGYQRPAVTNSSESEPAVTPAGPPPSNKQREVWSRRTGRWRARPRGL